MGSSGSKNSEISYIPTQSSNDVLKAFQKEKIQLIKEEKKQKKAKKEQKKAQKLNVPKITEEPRMVTGKNLYFSDAEYNLRGGEYGDESVSSSESSSGSGEESESEDEKFKSKPKPRIIRVMKN